VAPVSPARKAFGLDDEVDDIIGQDESRISMSSLVKQGVSAVLVGLLGVVALAGVSTFSAPYSTAAASSSTTIAGAVDVTRAEPVLAETDADLGASSTQDTTADLNDPSRNEDLSRNSLRAELNKAVSEEMEQQRSDSLAQVQEQVAAGAQNSATDARAAALTGQSGAITGEQARLKAEAAAAAAAKAAAEKLARQQAALAAGTLKTSTKSTANNAASTSQIDLSGVPSSGGCVAPMSSYIRGAGWGAYGSWSRYHTGIDLSASYGTPIRAVCDGVVLAKDGGGWAGINVSIAHPGGGATLYAHMSARTVRAGDTVKAGQIIGYVGLTGRTFGPHLHLEYYPNPGTIGDPYTSADPASFLLRKGVRL